LNSLYSRIAISDSRSANALRAVYRYIRNFSLPAPRWIFRPLLAVFLLFREIYYFSVRVLICEPFFKACCTAYGRNLHTGVFLHWIQGSGRLIVGDNVTIDGKCSFVFAVRYSDRRLLRIGNNVVIGHRSSFIVGREITIGDNVLIGNDVTLFDSPGHPTDPALRLAGSPALPEDVRPIHVESNVWVGSGSIIYPGVTLGEGCVVARGSVVMSSVSPYVVVAGSPARQIRRLRSIQDSIDKHLDAEQEIGEIKQLLNTLLGGKTLDHDDDIYEAGLTSIMALPLLCEIENAFGLSISDNEFLDARTPRALAQMVHRLRGV